MTAVVVTISLAIVGWVLWIMRKAGKDSVRADTAEKVIEQVSKANAPIADADIQRVSERYRRD
jgi:hypothetical protein